MQVRGETLLGGGFKDILSIIAASEAAFLSLNRGSSSARSNAKYIKCQ